MADEILAHGITREVRRPNAILRGMAKHPELFCILFTLFVTFLSNYGSSFKSKPVVIPARMPQPLFPSVPTVLDLYLGDLRPLVEALRQEDLIFVMYYAPWCAKSRSMVSQFTRAAEFLNGQVRFVAVNCWYPEGLCRKQYKFLVYPVFFAYHGNNDGYRYLGIQRAEFMVKFLEDLLHPLTFLTSVEKVKDFVTQHDTVVVGRFDFNSSPQPPGYQQFFYAAMRVVEHDPYQPVKFGVVTDPALAVLCHLTQPSDIVFLRINNSTLKFPLPTNITSTNIVTWVFSYRHQLPVRWIVPLGVKSLTLSREINKGPAVIMFHKVSPLSTASQSFSVFKDLALRYNQCPGDNLSKETTRRWLTLSARSVIQHARQLNSCRGEKKGQLLYSDTVKCCITTALKCRDGMLETKLNVCEICQHRSEGQRFGPSLCSFRKNDKMRHWITSATQLPSNSCQNSIANYDVSSHSSVCCKWCYSNVSYTDFLAAPFTTASTLHRSSKSRRPTDRYVIDSLENLPRKLCNRLTFQKKQTVFPSAIIPDLGSSALPAEFTGRGCQANRTLSFISLDSQNHWMFAERLGLNVSQAHLSPVIVVFDKEKEEQQVLKEKFSKKNTASFILNFTRGMVKREQRSLPSLRQASCTSSPSLCVTELTTHTFQAAISQPKDLVLLVYAGWCGFCAALSHVFLHLAHYFHTSTDITFARINGEINDLPWEFSMESYPTIIFFPAHRESDSIAFPDNINPSLPNLIRFVLQHATFTTRFHLAADVCSATCVQENLDLCRHTLHALHFKLRHLQSRWSTLHHTYDRTKVSYHSAMETILKERLKEIQGEIEEVNLLKEFLESSRGRRLDPTALEKVLYNKEHLKGLHAKR